MIVLRGTAYSLLLWGVLCVVAPASATDAAPPYLSELIQHAAQAKLAEEREWHLLLHYRKTFWGGYESEADDPGFFLAPDGKTDPQAELNATLARFFSDEPVGRSKQPAQCAFVARYQWLKTRLRFDERRLPPMACERFRKWSAEMNAEGLSMIFPSAYLNNPSSMFGHTFLRVDRQGQSEQTRLLAYTINYAADVPEDAGWAFILKGVFGGYKGYFSTVPYYLKVQEYRDIENRDIWEYRLNLTDAQLRRLLMHAWELGNADFDYFFFKENCSYHLLSLLEYADPSLHLTDRFWFWTIPVDTVRLLARQANLVGALVFRPARSSVIRWKRSGLSDAEQRWFAGLMDRPALASDPEFLRLPVERQIAVLDLVSDALRYRSVTDEQRAESYKEKDRQVLLSRSRIRMPSAPPAFPSPSAAPEEGHGTSRAGLGVGWRNGAFFEDWSLRLAYHDLLDPDAGYSPNAQIELLSASLRHYQILDRTRLEKLTLANIVSLSPLDAFFHAPSWKVSGGWETVVRPGCEYCGNFNVNGGFGGSMQTDLAARAVWFTFAEADANWSHAYAENHRLGGGGTVGTLVTLTDRWKLLASGSYLRYPLGDRSDDLRLFVGQRYTLARNAALRFEFNRRDDDTQTAFYLHVYF
jgi:hypothetical protein